MSATAALADRHAELIRASAISDEVRDTRGYWTAAAKHELRDLGFSERQQRVPALVVPVYSVMGEVALHQVRPDSPRSSNDGKPIRYETPAKAGMALDVPPTVRHLLANPAVPLFITEGVRKADSAASIGLCCVALLGVWNWRGTNDAGGKTALADFELIALNGRDVYITFDSDVVAKLAVHEALRRLKTFLEGRGATVHIVYLPTGEHGAKVGLDDYLAAGHTKDELLALATTELRKPARPATRTGVEWQSGPYTMTAAGIVYAKPTREGTVDLPLTNFAARISSQVTEDDGAERRLVFEMQAQLKKQAYTFDVPGAQFANLNWATEQLGAEAIIWPGTLARDHARVAIQVLSGSVPRRVAYCHTGWRLVDGRYVYLHAAGAIGPIGPIAGVETNLGDGLEAYCLPDPPIGDALVNALRTSLRLWDVAPDQVGIPVSAAVYRAPLGSADFSLHLAGPTHAGKSELAALGQQHLGPAMDSRHLPASWSSTANQLEATAFTVKDSLLVVDDFCPTGSTSDVQRMHREADRLLRAQGNRSARGRMRPDGTLRPLKPPRGLIISTGEDVPRGQSLRGRLLIVELGPDDLKWDLVTELQAAGASGELASAMSGYVSWLARQGDGLESRVRNRVLEFRSTAVRSAGHRRTPEIVANLAVGVEYFLRFAAEMGAIHREEGQARWERAWRALGEAGQAQPKHQESQEPTTRFLELLRAALASGAAHLADREGCAPDSPTSWGWRSRIVGVGAEVEQRWEPQGRRIGWVHGDNVYLEPDAAFEVVLRGGQVGGESLTVGLRTLQSRLHEKGLLASIDERGDHRRLTARISDLEGRRRSVLHLLAMSLFPERDQWDQRDQPGPATAPSELDGDRSWSQKLVPSAAPTDEMGPAEGTTTPEFEFGNTSPGPFGPIGPFLGDKTLATPNGKRADQIAHERQVHAGAAVEWWMQPDGPPVCGVCHPRPGVPSTAACPTCGGPVTGPLTGGWWCRACKDYVRPVASRGGGQ